MTIEKFRENQEWLMTALENEKEVLCWTSIEKMWIKMKLKQIELCSSEVCFNSYYYKIKQIKTETETRVKRKLELVLQLLDEGYLPDHNGDWWDKERENLFRSERFVLCGKKPYREIDWNPSWLEEVEITVIGKDDIGTWDMNSKTIDTE